MSAALKGELIRSLPAFPGRAQQKKQSVAKKKINLIPWLLVACLQPPCVGAAGWLPEDAVVLKMLQMFLG